MTDFASWTNFMDCVREYLKDKHCTGLIEEIFGYAQGYAVGSTIALSDPFEFTTTIGAYREVLKPELERICAEHGFNWREEIRCDDEPRAWLWTGAVWLLSDPHEVVRIIGYFRII